jgi:hypothetical protein
VLCFPRHSASLGEVIGTFDDTQLSRQLSNVDTEPMAKIE